jgi:hypothetical protein
MKTARFILLAACFLPIFASAAEDGPPAWAVTEKETLTLKKVTQPSYLEIEHTATVLRPKALTRAEDIEKLNPGLIATLPGIRDLASKASVSPKFKQLYDAKIKLAAEGAPLATRYYFDCATALDLKDAKSGRSVFLFQSDMDTDTDGTDPVRLSQLKDYDDARISRSFQPLLAYSWSKGDAGAAVNPFPKYFEDTLGQMHKLQKQIESLAQSDPGPVWHDMKKHFEEQAATIDRRAKYYHSDLVSRRSLIASLDPFIVLPQSWVAARTGVGDFAAVIYAGQVYPCIVGDTGPVAKTGEASQRLARAINPKASGKVSAVTTVGVTYLVFPGTRAAMGAPDLAHYYAEVKRLLGEIGGLGSGVKLHSWK